MNSTLPTYSNYNQFPAFLQGSGVPYIFQVTDLKTPEFLRIIEDGQALTVYEAILTELDLHSLKVYKEYKVLNQTVIPLLDTAESAGSNFLRVYGTKVADRLTADKLYTIKVIMSDMSEFYTDIFMYCTANQN